MAHRNPSTCGRIPQDYLGELSAVFSSLNDSALLVRLQEYRPTGRQGYPLKALWRAYVGSFVLNLAHTNALIRRLEDDADFRTLCGFGALPHRRTFNRFIRRLSHHADLVEATFADLTHHLKTLVPDLGREVAVDATTVRSHCNPNRKRVSDPEASWTAKNSPRAKEGAARSGITATRSTWWPTQTTECPWPHLVTTAKRNDSPELPAVIARAEALYAWFKPSAVIADRGYDSTANHEHLHWKGIVPVIHIRRSNAHDGLHEGIYTKQGVPTCLGISRWSTSGATRRRATCTGARAVTWPGP